ncbi:MAG TPA: aldehyde dehydrogenase family protein [Porticoccus sp.]|nr:aldehyde dehydrogenase family protein [Porticoccus sp.]
MDDVVSALLRRYGATSRTCEFLAKQPRMYIDGHFKLASNGETIDSIEPSTGGFIASIPAASEQDVALAVAAARNAFDDGCWSTMKPNQREKILHRLADLIEENAQTIAEIETLDNGKAITGCLEVDVATGADLLHYMAGWPSKVEGATRDISFPGNTFAYTLREPLGVVAAIVPWNWPFNMAMWKLAAPLAAGCTLVMKPAQQTSLSLLFFAELCEEAGIPPGVVNIVSGRGSSVGNYLASHPDVNKVSFTGSTEVGKVVGRAGLENMARLTLELGGKSPMIAFEDADLKALAEATLDSVYFNAGQVCSAGSRLYVHRSVYAVAIDEIKKVIETIKLGPGLDTKTVMGPVISASAQQSIIDYINLGVSEGAELVVGGSAVNRKGYFVEPTLLGNCANDMKVVQEEIFGPVLCVIAFDDEDEAVRLANDNIYGLAASVWTKDISRALRVVPQIKAGSVWVNGHDLVDNAMPFGGYKQSGFGRDLGPEQLAHFLETKSVVVNI